MYEENHDFIEFCQKYQDELVKFLYPESEEEVEEVEESVKTVVSSIEILDWNVNFDMEDNKDIKKYDIYKKNKNKNILNDDMNKHTQNLNKNKIDFIKRNMQNITHTRTIRSNNTPNLFSEKDKIIYDKILNDKDIIN